MNTKLGWKIFATTITSVILVAITASPLAAEEPIDNSEYIYCCHGNQSGWGRRQYSRRYNLNNVETLNAKVISVDAYTSRRGNSQGIHLLVNTDKETVEVHLGPSWYLEDQDFDITAEDEITITGSRINLNGEEAIVASQIEKGNKTLILRDENGFPMWSGWRR